MSTETPSREMHYFAMLTQEEQRQAIAKLAASGASDYLIASATRLSVEMVRKILGEERALLESVA